MAVLKNKTQGNYVNVNKNILQDKSLKLRERGLLITLLSLPDNWELTIRGLACILPDGKEAIQKGLHVLEQKGYLVREQERANNGKFSGNVIEVHDVPCEPCPGFPYTVNRDTEKPHPEYQPQYINNKSYNKGFNNYVYSNKEKVPSYKNFIHQEYDMEELEREILSN